MVDFSIEFYCYGVACMVAEWSKKGMKEPPELLAERIFYNMPPDWKKFMKH